MLIRSRKQKSEVRMGTPIQAAGELWMSRLKIGVEIRVIRLECLR